MVVALAGIFLAAPLTYAQAGEDVRLLFQERCANCHGVTGSGDGELAADLPNPPAAFTAETLWNAQPQILFETISNGRIDSGMPPFGIGTESSNPISENNRWKLVELLYNFAADPALIAQGELLADGMSQPPPEWSDPDFWREASNAQAFSTFTAALDGEYSEIELRALTTFGRLTTPLTKPVALIAAGTITGQITNGSTGEAAGEMPALLRAFTPELQLAMTLSATVAADGSYAFDLSQTPDDWVYMASALYQGISFSSDVGRLSLAQANLNLPIQVYEQSSDPSALAISRLHLVIDLSGDTVQMSELYAFDNNSSFIFVGESGDPEAGAAKIAAPEGAAPIFQKGFGSVDSFIPTDDLFFRDGLWFDTSPLRPGQGALNLLAQYDFPYEDGATIRHGLPYGINRATLVMEDVGVTLGGDWTLTDSETQSGRDFLLYELGEMPANSELILPFSGKIRQPGAVDRDENLELAIGLTAFAVAIGGSVFALQRWRKSQPLTSLSKNALLQAAAELDDAYERGAISAEAYADQRAKLKKQLLAVWSDDAD